MNISYTHPSLDTEAELQTLGSLKAFIEASTLSGKLSRQRLEIIGNKIQGDGQVTAARLMLVRQLIWEKVYRGDLELDWE